MVVSGVQQRLNYTHICTYICTHTYVYMYTHVYVYMYTHMYVYMYTHVRIYVHTCTYICTHICTYICTHMYIYMYTHMYVYMYTCVLRGVWLYAAPWTVACQAPLSMEFSRQVYWSQLPFPTLGERPDTGIEPMFCISCTGRQILYHQHHLGSGVIYVYYFSDSFPYRLLQISSTVTHATQ